MGGWGYSNKSKILQISNHFDLQHFDLFEIISYIPFKKVIHLLLIDKVINSV